MPAIRARKSRPALNGHCCVQCELTFTVTGEQPGNRWLLFVNDHATTLTGEEFRALMVLVLPAGGCARVERNTIHRLRKAFEPALGHDGAAALIQYVDTDEYRLALEPKEFKKRFLATRCFFARAAKLFCENDVKSIRKLCHIVSKKRAEELLDRDWNVTG